MARLKITVEENEIRRRWERRKIKRTYAELRDVVYAAHFYSFYLKDGPLKEEIHKITLEAKNKCKELGILLF